MIAPDWVFTIMGKVIFACGGYVLLLYVLGIAIMKAINSSGQYATFFKIAQDYFKRKREAAEKERDQEPGPRRSSIPGRTSEEGREVNKFKQ